MTIPIYQTEIDDGLQEAVANDTSVAFDCQAEPIERQSPWFSLASVSNSSQPDLFPFASVLVSVGWNKNDDVFDREETWSARRSPVNKKFNFMHDEKDIIGHMTDSIVLDSQGKVIADANEPPSQFDIAVSAVLYRAWADNELQERMNKLIKEIAEGKWFVSMECLFKNFDYAVVDPEGHHKVIPRNESSAFLTKHLKAYGGRGEYNGHRVGRFLRDFVFSGNALVNNPANPRSIIFHKQNPFSGTQASIETLSENEEEETEMADSNTTVQDQLRKAEASIEELKKENKALSEKLQAVDEEKYKEKIQALENQVSELQEAVSEKDELVSTQQEKLDALEKEKEEKDKSIASKDKEIEKMKTDMTKSERLSTLVDAGLDKEKAEAVVEKFANADNEMFNEVVELHKQQIESQGVTDKDDDDDDNKTIKRSNQPKKVKDSTSADVDLDNLETDDSEVTDAGAGDKVQKAVALQKSAASWLAGNVLTTTAGRKIYDDNKEDE